MTGTSLHTKYRPTKFSEVIGQDKAVANLKKVVKEKRAHSFLFTGPAGTGKTTIARLLANAFAGADKGTQANLIEVAAATHTGVDAMREVAATAHYRAIGKSPIKAFIIDECHRISAQAWDSLLKPIEEPPTHVYWMLCTTELSKVPKTIQTRCLRIDLKPLSEEAILEVLNNAIKGEGLEIDNEIVETIAENSGGSARQALVYLEACLYCETAAEAREEMRTAGEQKDVIDFARFLLKGRGKWSDAMKLLKNMKGAEAESIRIVTVNYLSAVLMNAKSEKEAQRLLGLIECFSTPYNTSDKMAPLLLSVGEALMDE